MGDIADALIQALLERNVKTVYGVPGDFVLGLFDRFQSHPSIELVCFAGEEGAAFAADAEARLNGLGVVMITYGVGALKILNAIGGAYAEYSPVLVISGAPGVNSDRGGGDDLRLIHHSVYKHEDSVQRRMFQEVCVESASLDSPSTAEIEIAKVLNGIRASSRPGYLQIPRDRISRELPFPISRLLQEEPVYLRPSALNQLRISEVHRERGGRVLEWMRSKERPVVLAGVHIQRFGLQALLLRILEREGWMCATSLTGKSLIPESHPLSLGIYNGAMTSQGVREDIESSDGVLMIGFPLQDVDTGMFTMSIPKEKLACVDIISGLRWSYSEGDEAKDELLLPGIFLKVLSDAEPPSSSQRKLSRPSLSPKMPCGPFLASRDENVKPTVLRLIEAVGSIIDEYSVVLAEVGDSLFAAADLHIPLENRFLTSGFWCSLGFVLPGAVGAYFSDKENNRPVVLIGDGSFLMSAIECATLARYNVPAIVIVLDNEGYGTERPMLDGAYNDVQPVDHVMLAKAYGFKAARRATTELEMFDGLQELDTIRDGPTLLSVSLDKFDSSNALKNLTANLKKQFR